MTFEPKTDEVGRIEAALDELLSAINDHEEHNPRGETEGSATEAVREHIDLALNGTMAEFVAAGLLNDPVGASLRGAIRNLGERLYEIGGLELMRQVCSRLEAQDTARSEIRAGILDHQWDGIGFEDGPGWAA